MASPIYYLILNSAGITIGSGYSPDGTMSTTGTTTRIPCTQTQAKNWQYCTVANGVVTQGPPPPPTLVQQATAAMANSYNIISSTTLGLGANSTPFAIDTATQNHINSEVTALLLNNTFADGTANVGWPDVSTPIVTHTFTVPQFKIFAGAIGSYVAALYKVLNGTANTMPSSTITI